MPQYSVEDLKTPSGIERVLRQFSRSIDEKIPSKPDAKVDLSALGKALAPVIRNQLQASGVAPLNLTDLLPVGGATVIIEGTHASRASLYTPPSLPGLLFWETDRNVIYVSINTGPLEWHFAAGVFVESFSARPADLGSTDEGFLFFAADTLAMYIWDGAAWQQIAGTQEYPLVIDTVVLTGQTASIAPVVFADSDAQATYRVNYYLETTAVDAGAGDVEVDITWADDAGSVTLSSAMLPLTTLGRTSGVAFIQEFTSAIAPLVTRGYLFGTSFVVTAGYLVPFTPIGAGIDYSTTVTGSIGTAAYALYLSLERMSA